MDATRGRGWQLAALLLCVLAAGQLLLPRAVLADTKEEEPKARCLFQKPLPFLVRKSFVRNRQLVPEANARAIKWRVEHYGHVPGLGLEKFNREPVTAHVRTTTFFGLPITLHEKVAPLMFCVERRIRRSCKGGDKYEPKAIGGLRTTNTYRQGEVSNHLFGIAIDIDPDRNPCCGCVDPWPTHPACQKNSAQGDTKGRSKTAYEKAELPRCWIKAFEKYGFYWLGHDDLEDTMHFEYLANPDDQVPRKR